MEVVERTVVAAIAASIMLYSVQMPVSFKCGLDILCIPVRIRGKQKDFFVSYISLFKKDIHGCCGFSCPDGTACYYFLIQGKMRERAFECRRIA